MRDQHEQLERAGTLSFKRKIVHLGAHRTGTTSMQMFLRTNSAVLADHGIGVFVPPGTRQGKQLPEGNPNGVIVSEENILGTMENNILNQSLYPDIARHHQRHHEKAANATAIMLSIRRTSEWWRSAILFCCQKTLALPKAAMLDAIANSERGWSIVVDDLRKIYPDIPIIVRDFSWKTGNPKQFLKRATHIEAIDKCKSERTQHNISPAHERLASAFASRSDFESLTSIRDDLSLSIFSEKQVMKLDEKYRNDIEALSKRSDIEFLYDKKEAHTFFPLGSSGKKLVHSQPRDHAKTCLLNIGKTGTSRFRQQIGNTNLNVENVRLCNHSETLPSTISKFGVERKVGFFFRDPIERFVSSFEARLRQGRPDYESPWSTEEAISFSYFLTANSLAEGLTSGDERLRSASAFAFRHIFHINRTLEYYLTSANALDYEFKNDSMAFCCESGKINKHVQKIADSLGLPTTSWTPISEPDLELNLSTKAIENLRTYFQRDYEIYDRCQLIAADMGYV